MTENSWISLLFAPPWVM